MQHKEVNNLLKPEIIADYRRVAQKRGASSLSRNEYLQDGQYSGYHIYDGGNSHEAYCEAAGLATKSIEQVPDEVYFERLKRAIAAKNGVLPLQSERKKFGLNFTKRRWRTLALFIEDAIGKGIIQGNKKEEISSDGAISTAPMVSVRSENPGSRQVPPIPSKTRRKNWERTGLEGFPYAPQDEQGVVAVFAILCVLKRLNWEIVEMSNKGIDATCFDHDEEREIRVEIKHVLSRTSWDHNIDEVDAVVCWENRYHDFPKKVVELKSLLRRA